MPARELVGMLEDHVKVVRFERRVRLADRVRNILIEKGMPGPTRARQRNERKLLCEIRSMVKLNK